MSVAKNLAFSMSLLLVFSVAQAEVNTMACKSFDTTHTFARLYIKNAMLKLQALLSEHTQSGNCAHISIPDKSHMIKMRRGQEDLDRWLEETNALAANFKRPPITERFFFVSITLPDGSEVYSLESTRFIN